MSCFLLAILCVTPSIVADDFTGEFYIDVNGNDSNNGSANAPFATLERARDAIRSERASGKEGAFCVKINEGEYVRTEPFLLNSSDFQTSYIGVDSKTTLTGGRDLKGWKIATDEQKKKFPNSDSEIWRAELPQVDGTPVFFEQLFVNERRGVRARYPNEGFLRPASIWEEFSMNPQTRRAEQTSTPQELRAKTGDLDNLKLAELSDNELHFAQFIVHHHWDTTRRILLGFDSKSNALKAQGAPMKSWNPWRDSSLYYLENLRTAFDAKGEWFYDGIEKAVYYRPLDGEKIDATRFVAPISGVNQMLVLEGANDVRFENIRFAYTDAPRREATMKEAQLDPSVSGDLSKPGPSQFEPAQSAAFTTAVIIANNASKFVMQNCEVSHIGEYGLWLKECSDCEIQRTDFIDLGAGAIRIGGSLDKLDVRNKVENCLMTQGGRFFASATAVWIGQNTEEIAILHNDINDFFYTGVSVGWVWGYNGGHAFRNRIEFNRIWKIGQGAMSDMGGVYTLGTSTGTRICNNVIFDVSSYAYGGWGLYPDEGSEGILLENNLVYDTTDGSFHQHYGKNNVVRNNILARSKTNPANAGTPPHQIAITRVEEHLSDTFENNIIYWKEGVALGYNANNAKAVFSKNLWYNVGGEATFAGKTHEEWSKESGKDVDGLVADPLFVDPDVNDFHLKPDSPALKLGFVPFDYTQAGISK